MLGEMGVCLVMDVMICSIFLLGKLVNKFKLIIILRQATLPQVQMEDNTDQLFQLGKDHPNLCMSPTTLQNMHQYRLISQYLTLKSSPQTATFSQQINNSKSNNPNQTVFTPPSSHEGIKQSNKPSSFHNFQKHLMTTLKKGIKIKRTNNSSHCRANIASQIWQYFLRCNRPSKRTILCVLMGSLEGGSTVRKQQDEYQKMLAFFSEYSEREINSAQEYLCREVIKQSSRLVQNNAFQSRRINKSEDFKNYFIIFIKELEDRKISLRIPKKSLVGHVQIRQRTST